MCGEVQWREQPQRNMGGGITGTGQELQCRSVGVRGEEGMLLSEPGHTIRGICREGSILNVVGVWLIWASHTAFHRQLEYSLVLGREVMVDGGNWVCWLMYVAEVGRMEGCPGDICLGRKGVGRRQNPGKAQG